MKTTPYYLLFVQDFDGYFACELGSYSKKEIMDNKEYYYMNIVYRQQMHMILQYINRKYLNSMLMNW